MLNRIVLVGRLTKDPEMKVSQSNIAICNFNLAVNRPFTDKNTGERGADFLPIVVFRKQAETVAQSLRKGSLVAVDGRVQTRNYENKDGQRVYVTEVVADSVQFLEPKNAGQGNQQNNNSYQNAYGQQQPSQQQYGNQGGYNQGGQPPQQQYNQGGQQYGNQGGYNQQPQYNAPQPNIPDAPPANQQYNNQGNQQYGRRKPSYEENPFQGNAGSGPVINDDDLPF